MSPDVPIVVLASAVWETPTPVNAHQIARRFAARGHPVLFVESTGLRSPALGSSHDLRRVRQRLARVRRPWRRLDDRLAVLSPLALPWGWPRPARALSMRWLGRTVRRAVETLGMRRPVLWTFLPTYLGVWRQVDAALRVYHCVDHYAANPGVDRDWIDGLERRIVREADLVLASSPVLAERLGGPGADVRLVENVADTALFAGDGAAPAEEPAALRDAPRPRLVYAGNLASYRIDFEVLDGLAARLPDASVVIVGVVGMGDVGGADRARDAFLARPNVRRLDPVPQAELPRILHHCDVALIPFADNEHTRGSLPLKLWEYLGAGLPVVATDLPNLAAHADEGMLYTTRGAEGFATAVQQCLGLPAAPWRHRRQAEARRHDWAGRMDELEAMLDRALA